MRAVNFHNKLHWTKLKHRENHYLHFTMFLAFLARAFRTVARKMASFHESIFNHQSESRMQINRNRKTSSHKHSFITMYRYCCCTASSCLTWQLRGASLLQKACKKDVKLPLSLLRARRVMEQWCHDIGLAIIGSLVRSPAPPVFRIRL